MRSRDRIARAIVRLYPRAWRERYADEMTALVEARAVTASVLIDLVRGALREWGRQAVTSRDRPLDLRRERWRRFRVTFCYPLLPLAASWQLASLLKRAGIVPFDSDWWYLPWCLPMLLAMARSIQMSVRRQRLKTRAQVAGTPFSFEEETEIGLARAEYVFWWASIFLGWTVLRANGDGTTLNVALNLYSMLMGLALLRRENKAERARRARVNSLARSQGLPLVYL